MLQTEMNLYFIARFIILLSLSYNWINLRYRMVFISGKYFEIIVISHHYYHYFPHFVNRGFDENKIVYKKCIN